MRNGRKDVSKVASNLNDGSNAADRCNLLQGDSEEDSKVKGNKVENPHNGLSAVMDIGSLNER